ncbi:MAG: thiamine pyrophosphate-binding protein [Deltaproteobacteria bacterium GWA2_38_16]|nr:MAG: thiamine pyrophosphate-binding protein [Deltaproteobacteria bacterium GWA2_38_16]OGQ03622.1 MAG: thiamine pyrophosphate-binding protein [Deltaproteobacteria bacterium RIFCSPHIGHO2_02_FULL_38_15]OGQ35036.1 MAG: thiamine pyrophosphate-binding protein [Deltaproteobacteria bacterium RIFCSPLOWO2_01_FULL_38_9]OGQ61317.1 MAG: thiamine pyrophosphate-binding protein [Deltaproteobacteria bacterium RIFCSPLOWO2_12_FULL_38_8]HBQ21132.1 thiamine pyrophosphate-binding protein [Deltaproteobacteria bact
MKKCLRLLIMTKHSFTLDISEFNEKIVGEYNAYRGDKCLPADINVARSIIPPGTSTLRDFSYIAPDIPVLVYEKCVGCMDCVVECPDTAILGKVVTPETLTQSLSTLKDPSEKERLQKYYIKTKKYYETYEKKGTTPGLFNITIDPTKCKGCGECVEVCGDKEALIMVKKDETILKEARNNIQFYKKLPETPKEFINERLLSDMMLAERSLLFTGGAGSCMGCGEATAIRMMLAATGFVYGKNSCAIVASTGCNTVYASTYPYNPFLVPWTNSLFENNSADAMGIRMRWNQIGFKDKKLWAIGGDGAMLDIGFQSLSRLLTSGMDIKVLILDTQAYSNTGGQASTGSFLGQDAKMSTIGKAIQGKTERRKEIANIAMMHPDVFVAQTVSSLSNHFYNAIMAANEYPGPAVINVYTSCQPEHGIADDASASQGKLAVYSRAFPLLVYDPRAGTKMKERLSLRGNPAVKEDWYKNPSTGETVDFISFAKTEGRFSKQFDKEGKPSQTLQKSQEDRLSNWHLLQELAGLI